MLSMQNSCETFWAALAEGQTACVSAVALKRLLVISGQMACVVTGERHVDLTKITCWLM